jgi:hypothetical protein
LEALFNANEYNIGDSDDETVKNMVNRYDDIIQSFPEEIEKETAIDLQFEPHPNFKMENIHNRLGLVRRLCESIWSIDYYKE